MTRMGDRAEEQYMNDLTYFLLAWVSIQVNLSYVSIK